MADTTHTLPHVIMYCVALLPNTHSRSRATQAQLRAALRRSQHIEQELSTLQSKAAAADQLTEKVAARTFAKGFLSELHSSVVDNLKDAGFFYDPLEQEVTSNFLPGLMQQVDVQLESMRTSRQLAGELIEAAAVRSQAMLAEAAKLRTEVEAAKAKVAAEKKAAEKKAAKKKAAAAKKAAVGAE